LESTNSRAPRPNAAWRFFSLGLGVALTALMTARTGLATAPPAAPSRRLQLRGFPPASPPVAPWWQLTPVRLLKRPEPRMWLEEATRGHLNDVLGLIEDASRWLKTQGTDQWAKPWPDEEQRDARVIKGLENKKTWILRCGNTPAATVTIANWHNPEVWTNEFSSADLTERAVYLHRLITARKYAGRGLGEWLINWAAERAHAKYGAKWIRIDVWTSNENLHRYYEKLGFKRCGTCPIPGYPSGALFQKAITQKAITEFRKEQPLAR
jgi:ribosomal protein S18 acetylase RimI-like enzyme